MEISLLDLLVGGFPATRGIFDAAQIDKIRRMPGEAQLRDSIVENLTLLLRTRQGSVFHLPDFGLPDIMQLYYQSGQSSEPLKAAIEKVILQYEPRISKVTVEKEIFDPFNMRISFHIAACIKNVETQKILLTEFTTDGWAIISYHGEKR